jgi:hypothetical protein
MSVAQDRNKLEVLCRYFTRSAVCEKRLALTEHGKIRYQLKTPYRDGTTHVIFEPLDFTVRLAALVHKLRVNLTRLDEKHPVYHPSGNLRSSKFIPDEFVVAFLRQTVNTDHCRTQQS